MVHKNLIGRSLFVLAVFALSPHYHKLSEISFVKLGKIERDCHIH